MGTILGLLTPPINAIGYHSKQNYLYGIAYTTVPQTIVRIGATGAYEIAGEIPIGIANQPLLIGDIDGDQQYWLGYSNGLGWVQVNLDASAATYGEVVLAGAATNFQWPIGDWAWIPAYPTRLYALGQETVFSFLGVIGSYNTHLVYFDTVTHAWFDVRTFVGQAGGPLGQANWGAIYTANDGNIYGTESITGQTWRFPMDPSSPAQPSLVYAGIPPLTRQIDGARCPLNNDLTANLSP